MNKPLKVSLKQQVAALGLVVMTMGATAAAAEKPLATVNGVAISQSLVDAYITKRPSSASQQDDIVNELVSQELLVQEAKRHGIDKNPGVQAEIELLKRGVLAAHAVQSYIEEHPISEADMKAEYKKIAPTLSVSEYKARHILLKTEDEAKAVIAELGKGGDFAALAKSKSTGPSASQGGDLGWFNPAQMVAPFAEAVKALKKGAYSSTPVQTQFGWHVILLEDSRVKPAPSFETVKPQLKKFMEQKAVQEHLKSLEEKAKIVR